MGIFLEGNNSDSLGEGLFLNRNNPDLLKSLSEFKFPDEEDTRSTLKQIIKKEAKESLTGRAIRQIHKGFTGEPLDKLPETKYTPWKENFPRALLEHAVATGTNIGADLPLFEVGGSLGKGISGASTITKLAETSPNLAKVAKVASEWGVPLAAYEGVKNPLEQVQDTGKYDPIEHAKAVGEGFVGGTVFGVGAKALGKGIELIKGKIGERIPTSPSDVTLSDMNKSSQADNILNGLISGKPVEVEVHPEVQKVANKVQADLQKQIESERAEGLASLNKQLENPSGTQKGILGITANVRPTRATVNKISKLTGADVSGLARHVNETEGTTNEALMKFGQSVIAPIDKFTKRVKLSPETTSEYLQHLLALTDDNGMLTSPQQAAEFFSSTGEEVPKYITEAFDKLPQIKIDLGNNFKEAIDLTKGIREKLNEMHNISKNTRIIEVNKVIQKALPKLEPETRAVVNKNLSDIANQYRTTGTSNLIESNSGLLEDLTKGLDTDTSAEVQTLLEPRIKSISPVTSKPNYIREMYDKSLWMHPASKVEKTYQGSEGARELINTKLNTQDSIFQRKVGDIPTEWRNKDIKAGLINYIRGFLGYNYQKPLLRDAGEVLSKVSSLPVSNKIEIKRVSDALNDAIHTITTARDRGLYKGDIEENVRRLLRESLPDMNPSKIDLIYNSIRDKAGSGLEKTFSDLTQTIGSSENKPDFDLSGISTLQRALLSNTDSNLNRQLGEEGRGLVEKLLNLQESETPSNISKLDAIKQRMLNKINFSKSKTVINNAMDEAVDAGVDLGLPNKMVRDFLSGNTDVGDFKTLPKTNIIKNMNDFIAGSENADLESLNPLKNRMMVLERSNEPGAKEMTGVFKELIRLQQERKISTLGETINKAIEMASDKLAETGKIKVKTDMSEWVGNYIINALRLNRPVTRVLDRSIVDSLELHTPASSTQGKLVKKELSGLIGKNINPDATWEDAWDAVLSQTYANLMGWRLTNIVRNFPFQVLLHHIPMTPATPKDSMVAFFKSLGNFQKILFDKEAKENLISQLMKDGVIQDVRHGEGLKLSTRVSVEGSPLGKVADKIAKFNDVGTYLFGMTERFNRMLSYFYSSNLMTDVIENNTGKALERKISDMLNPGILGESESVSLLNVLKTQGEKIFIKEYAKAMALKSQFSYNLASRSPILNNKLARGLLMFYKYPSEIAERYANYGKEIFKGNVRVPATALAKEISAGALTYIVGRELLNADMSDFASPEGLSYSARTPLISILVGMGDRPNKELAPSTVFGKFITANTDVPQLNKVVKLASPIPAAYRTSMGILGKDKARTGAGLLKKYDSNNPNQSTFGSVLDKLLKL